MSVVEILTQAGCRYLALSKGVKQQYRVQQQSACFLILQSSSPPLCLSVFVLITPSVTAVPPSLLPATAHL